MDQERIKNDKERFKNDKELLKIGWFDFLLDGLTNITIKNVQEWVKIWLIETTQGSSTI